MLASTKPIPCETDDSVWSQYYYVKLFKISREYLLTNICIGHRRTRKICLKISFLRVEIVLGWMNTYVYFLVMWAMDMLHNEAPVIHLRHIDWKACIGRTLCVWYDSRFEYHMTKEG